MKVPLWMLFLGFSAFIAISASLGLVYVSSRSVHGLVREDYYQAGLHLDEQRSRESGFDSLHLQLQLVDWTDSLKLEGRSSTPVDTSVLQRLLTYQVKLFLQRPDDPSADRELVLHPDFNPISGVPLKWSAPASALRQGRWNCQVVFEDNGHPRLEHSFAYFRGG